MTDELKPCPFCGKDMQRREYDYLGYTVYCANCGAIGPNELTEKRADEMWNLRRGEDALRAQLAERDALIERLVEAVQRVDTELNDNWICEGDEPLIFMLMKVQDIVAEYRAMKKESVE